MNGLGLGTEKSSYVSYTPVASDGNWWTGDGVNDYISGTANSPLIWSDLASQDLSFSFWVRIDSASKKGQKFIGLSEAQSSSDNFLIIAYLQSSNKLRMRIKSDGSTRDSLISLSQSGAGIANNTDGWIASQRGSVNEDGFSLITVTFDASASASNAFNWYWNGSSLTGDTSNGTFSSDFEPNFLTLGDAAHENNPTAGALGGALNEVKIYNKVLSAAEVIDIYNNGGAQSASTVGVTSGLITEFRLNDDVTDSANKFTSTNNGGVLN
jgi:hypothetical protein